MSSAQIQIQYELQDLKIQTKHSLWEGTGKKLNKVKI